MSTNSFGHYQIDVDDLLADISYRDPASLSSRGRAASATSTSCQSQEDSCSKVQAW